MIIREAVDTDVPALTELNRWYVENTVATFSTHVDSADERRAWMRSRQAKGRPLLIAETDDGDFLGFATYDQYRPSDGYSHTMEHSVYVRPDARRGGIGSGLMAALIDAAKADPEVWTLVAAIEGENIPSIKLHEKLGFTHGGMLPGVGFKFGRRLDVVYLLLEV